MNDDVFDQSGSALRAELDHCFPSSDYVAALGKTMLRSRDEIEQMLQARSVSPALADAVAALSDALQEPDPLATDDIFQASTNDRSAAMEIDGEKGLNVLPGSNGMVPGNGRDWDKA